MTPPALRPDESVRIYKKNGRLVILSVGEKTGICIGKDAYSNLDLPSFAKGVYIFAEKVTVASDVSVRNGLMVATWKFVGPKSGKRATLDASGIRGENYEGVKEKADGGNGGTIALYVQDLDAAAANAFTLSASGGDGGDTRSSTGKVGDGGKGGKIISVLQSAYLRMLGVVQRFLQRPEFDFSRESVWDQIPVVDTDPLYEAARVVLELGPTLPPFSKLSAELAKTGGSTVGKLYDAVNDAVIALSALITSQGNLVAYARDQVRGGYPGIGINVQVAAGKKGADGSLAATFLGSSESLVVFKPPVPFVHPEQCTMLLDRANTFFYIGSSRLRSYACALYRRLIDRLSFLPLKPSDTLYQGYKDYEDDGIMPPDSLGLLEEIRKYANTQLTRLLFGQTDFYGYTTRWVPRASYTFYEKSLNTALEDFGSFETAYKEYHGALETQENLTDKAKIASSNTSKILASLRKDKERLWSELQTLDGKISAMKPVVENAQTELKAAYKAEMAEINVAFGVTVPQIIDALKDIVAAPGKGGAGLIDANQISTKLLFEGFTTVPTIDGGKVTKEYLALMFKRSEESIMDMSLELKKKRDDKYPLDVAFNQRLVVEKDRILTQLDQFSKRALGGVNDEQKRKNLEEKFNAYIRAVLDRNELILQYNLDVNLLSKNADDKTKYENMKNSLNDEQVTNYNPDLADVTSYVSAIYHSSRSRVMNLLNVLLRALNFRMLCSRDVIDFMSGDADDPDSVPLSLTFVELTNARSNIEKSFAKQVEEWGSEPVRFPENADRGKRYSLDKHDRDVLISKKKPVTLTIPPVLPGSQQVNDFKGCCNVRVYRARFGFTGLKRASGVVAADALVHVQLTHGGNETIASRNRAIIFEHDSVSTCYSFSMRSDGSTSVLDNGNINEADINNIATAYAAPGPFAEWTVDLAGTEFEKLDFSGVTDAFFDFCGTNYACTQAWETT